MDAQLEEFFLKQKQINYISGCLIYFHYKVYKRVQKKKKEEAARKKKKKADAAKKKKKGFRATGGSFATKTPTPAPVTVPKPMQKATSSTAEKPKKEDGKKADDVQSTNLSQTLAPQSSMPLSETMGSGLERADTEVDGLSHQDSMTGDPETQININTNADLGSIVEQPGEGEEGKEGTVDGEGNPETGSREGLPGEPTVTMLGATGASEMAEGLE